MVRQRYNRRRIICLVILIVMALICGVGFFASRNYFNNSVEDGSSDKGSKSSVQSEQKDDEEIEEHYDDGKAKQYEGENPNDAEDLSGVITYAGIVDNKLMIRANIDQFLSEGTCRLNLFNENEVVYEDTADIINSASTATCEGFDVLIDKLDGDDLKIIIKIESSDKTGTIEGEAKL